VAAYPFTTLIPQLGVAEYGERRFVVADIPGLIEGASEGAGLGDRFLRHIERTRVIVHLLDAGAAALEVRDLLAGYDAIRGELEAYQPGLLDRTEIVALNKVDLVVERDTLDAVESELRRRGSQVVRTSGATGEGIDALLRSSCRRWTPSAGSRAAAARARRIVVKVGAPSSPATASFAIACSARSRARSPLQGRRSGGGVLGCDRDRQPRLGWTHRRSIPEAGRRRHRAID
jgi:GTPase involved in cell partitioning and DNA repair